MHVGEIHSLPPSSTSCSEESDIGCGEERRGGGHGPIISPYVPHPSSSRAMEVEYMLPPLTLFQRDTTETGNLFFLPSKEHKRRRSKTEIIPFLPVIANCGPKLAKPCFIIWRILVKETLVEMGQHIVCCMPKLMIVISCVYVSRIRRSMPYLPGLNQVIKWDPSFLSCTMEGAPECKQGELVMKGMLDDDGLLPPFFPPPSSHMLVIRFRST